MTAAKLTGKQKKFIEYFKQDPTNIAKAAKKAGYKNRNAGYETMQNHAVRTELNQFIEKFREEIPDDLLIQKVREGLEATKQDLGQGKRGVLSPDHLVRLKYLEMAYKIRFPGLFDAVRASGPEKLEDHSRTVLIQYVNTSGKVSAQSPLRDRPYTPEGLEREN